MKTLWFRIRAWVAVRRFLETMERDRRCGMTPDDYEPYRRWG